MGFRSGFRSPCTLHPPRASRLLVCLLPRGTRPSLQQPGAPSKTIDSFNLPPPLAQSWRAMVFGAERNVRRCTSQAQRRKPTPKEIPTASCMLASQHHFITPVSTSSRLPSWLLLHPNRPGPSQLKPLHRPLPAPCFPPLLLPPSLVSSLPYCPSVLPLLSSFTVVVFVSLASPPLPPAGMRRVHQAAAKMTPPPSSLPPRLLQASTHLQTCGCCSLVT